MQPDTTHRAPRRPAAGGTRFLAAIAMARAAAHLPAAIATPALLRPWLTPWTGPNTRLPDPQTTLRTPSGELAAMETGSGSTVLLLHGWGGRKEDMREIAHHLADHGMRALAVDLPFHGQSPGRGTTTIPALADATAAILDAIEPPVAIVAHSAGVMAASMAVTSGAGRRPIPIAGVAPMGSIASALDVFCASARLPLDARVHIAAALEKRFPDVTHDMDLSCLLRDHHAPLLMLHDPHDIRVSPDDMARLAAARTDARVVQVSDVGHHRILQDPRVADAVARFVLRASGLGNPAAMPVPLAIH